MNRLVQIIIAFLCLFSIMGASADLLQGMDITSLQPKENSKTVVTYRSLGKIIDNCIYVTNIIDLEEEECEIPQGMTLVFKGGIIKNGTIKGNNTKIKRRGAIFDHVIIKGSWLVPEISTDMFIDILRENVLKELFSLSSSIIRNTIIIEKGEYYVNAQTEWGYCLAVSSNTDLYINGTIKLIPNSYKGCDILRLEGDNIFIRGDGLIEGDKSGHLGTSGEWGMGINVYGSNNVIIKGLKINNCWGDCIYIGGNSRNVLIENCVLDNGRRQGISITNANGILVRDCTILNIGGTDPQYAIDVEPNSNDTVDNVAIKRVEVFNCKGGFLIYGKASTSKIGKVQIVSCKLSNIEKSPIYVVQCDKASVEKCQFFQDSTMVMIRCVEVNDVIVSNNSFYGGNRMPGLKNIIKYITGDNEKNYLIISKCGSSFVGNNKIKSK